MPIRLVKLFICHTSKLYFNYFGKVPIKYSRSCSPVSWSCSSVIVARLVPVSSLLLAKNNTFTLT